MQIRRQDPRIDPEDIQDMLSPLFHQKLLLVSRSQVMTMLTASYPDIEKIEIAKNYPSKLTITIYLEPVIAEIKIDEGSTDSTASGSVLSGSGTSSYSYVTKRGYFITSPMKIDSAPLPIITITDWAMRPQNRSLLLTEAFLHNAFLARDTLRRDFGLTTVNTVIFLRAQEFHIQTNKANLWFDLRSPLSVQFQRFRSFLKAVSFEDVKEYIDLRIADKIIYQ